MNPAKVNLTRRTHQTISFSSPRDKNIATESFQMIICMLGGIFSLPPSPFFFFFFFACSIHDVGERNYKLLPKFIHSLLLILPFLFLLFLLLFSFSLYFPSLPFSCLFCGVWVFFFLKEKRKQRKFGTVCVTDSFFSSPQGRSSNNDL